MKFSEDTARLERQVSSGQHILYYLARLQTQHPVVFHNVVQEDLQL